jgi:3-oxoacyl-(acyl-carrier-protein) synthase
LNKIAITSIASLSSLGHESDLVWQNYLNPKHYLQKDAMLANNWIAALPEHSKSVIEKLKNSDSKYKQLDNSVLFAIAISRIAIKNAGWNGNYNFGINIGSSRGATTLFEQYFETYLSTGTVPTLASPNTTLGNISSWVAHDLQTSGPEISHSITCSTALHALLNGVAWIKSGMTDKFLVGGSEAALTPFTLAQMQSLKIYAKSTNDDYPCKALDLQKKQNTLVLGEGAAMCCLEKYVGQKHLAIIEGIGYATEILEHNISISTEATCFQKSMNMALQNLEPSDIDVIVMHAPGTIKGDLAEFTAIEKVFGINTPPLTSNKWKIGHTFGASGMLSVEMAVMMLTNQQFIGIPFLENPTALKKINKIMVNSVGFGGNAVTIVIGL